MKKSALTLALAALLMMTGGSVATAQTKTEVAEVVQAADAAVYEWTFNPAYTDSVLGRDYYNASGYDGKGSYLSRVVYKDAEGQWHALPEDYYWIAWDSNTGMASLYGRLTTDRLQQLGLQRLVYDSEHNTATAELVMNRSRDGSYGVQDYKMYRVEKSQSGIYYTFQAGYFLKEFRTGSIRWIATGYASPRLDWLPDGRLLIERYSQEAKQKEIVAYDMSTGRTERLLLASFYGYDKQSGRLMVAYNEPSRRHWIYNLADGSLLPADSASEIDDFYRQASSGQKRASVPKADQPVDLQPQQLPVEELTARFAPEASVTILDKRISLPFAFKIGTTTMLPARSLADAGVLSVKQVKHGSAADSSFTLTGPNGSIELSYADSYMIGDRLYVSTANLRDIGLIPQQFSWTNRIEE